MTFKRVLNNLQPGTYAIRVKAVGSGLLDSEWSALFTVVVTGDTTPPPTPAAPTVSQSLAGINIIWDEPSYTVPVDFAGVEVYSSVDSYTTPIGFITVKGGVQPFTTQEYSTVYRFKFKAVDRSGNKSAFSPESNAISPAKLVESDVTAGILDFEEIPYKDNGNFVSDGSFETTARQNALIDINTALKISFGTSGAFLGTGSLNILSGGLNQDIYLMGDPASTSFVNQYPIIVNPSDVYLGRLAVRNQSGSAATVTLKMRVYKTDLTTTDLTLVTQSVSSSSSWQTLTVNTAQANRIIPANGYAAQIFVTSTREIAIDAVEVRQVIGTALIQDAAITNAQIQDATIQSAKIANLAAGKITSDSITSAELQISSTGKLYAGTSPSTGARLLFDVNGLRAFDSSNVNTVNISSNGSASFTGSLTATTGTFTGFMTAGQIRIGSGVSGSNNGIHNVTTGDYIYDNGLVRLGNGALVYNGSTLSINANGTFSGSLSSGISISAPVISGGTITGSLISTASSGSAISLNSSTNALSFRTGSTTVGHIVPLSSLGVIMHYGSSPDPNAGTFPQIFVGSSNVFAAASNTIYFSASSVGSIVSGSSINNLTINSSGAQLYGSSTNYLNITSSGSQLFGSSSNNLNINTTGIQLNGRVDFSSTMFAPNINTTANAANMRHGNLGEFLRSTSSSIRYKENIQNINLVEDLSPSKLLTLPVRSFTYKAKHLPDSDDRFGLPVPGFIAEEVAEHYPIAVDYVEGEIDSWNERFIIPGMLSLIQDLNKEISILKSRLDALEQ